MDLGIAGKTALVAASTGGLGLAVARALAAEGVRVAVVGRRRDRAKEIVAELQAAYGSGTLGIGSLGTSGFDAVAIEADLGTPEGIGSAVDQTVANLGPIDILVLNGPGPKPGAAATLTSEDMAAAFDLLVKPHHALVSKVLPGMRERRWGRILAIGSSGVTAPLPNLAVSNTGRAALAGYLKTLAAEVALDEVTVNLLLPGRIATDRVTQLDQAAAKRRGTTLEDIQLESRKTIPARRYGEPAEFGAAAAFLCSAPASYITGVALRCDGGLIRSL
ncbi:SDR family oxidoreductase [Arthrobacter sp. TES]|jgi:3-oxoacyl-[acyl-carrier protein] reductase|uniref:SDR family oxidoreductase n=1 Tax=Paenarthrobacter ureafaciens TaxID=37931 RepID=A0AAX3ELI3_PAEUR|nr:MULTISPECIES: SDR family oxidoreductase [Paenarthrobacter]AMB39600.1 3-oxoacyl-ACP reductase [Arthrobacter sp. ATCC 21022]AOY72446.1 3-oxoacyl-ACP reductase [Arthrobacter sp. ZXY-2]ERI37361.1 3-oxoacyl-ACP reductase [Arthrobacter sp. AK-YN10]NKR12534.1 3-oxoacyl-ACP reductase [Arthrobacter sp. M5]NKR17065.1 3-oxoacyl-ACP reductase [Arthrobacter sp. M6]OEH61220.1 3-oxoacyl-ACP reductase [Arthrobacter sp. D4]OEH61690.1 3-oxoacyl-ACP reductase [Arthrobacter sp. D2]QOI64116.1 SDR family oxid